MEFFLLPITYDSFSVVEGWGICRVTHDTASLCCVDWAPDEANAALDRVKSGFLFAKHLCRLVGVFVCIRIHTQAKRGAAPISIWAAKQDITQSSTQTTNKSLCVAPDCVWNKKAKHSPLPPHNKEPNINRWGIPRCDMEAENKQLLLQNHKT